MNLPMKKSKDSPPEDQPIPDNQDQSHPNQDPSSPPEKHDSGDSQAEGNVSNEEIEAELEAELGLLDEVNKWKETAARTAAELDNYRKRMARDKAESIKFANQRLLEDLLPVIDNFHMGMQAAASDQESMIYRGMEMVQKQLEDFLTNQGVTVIQADGQTFDPNFHEAISQEETNEAEDGQILHVIRRGYQLGDRLLRPANVIVAKKSETPDAGDSEQENTTEEEIEA